MGNNNNKEGRKIERDSPQQLKEIKSSHGTSPFHNDHLSPQGWRLLFLQEFSPKEIVKLSRICKLFYSITTDNEFWREKFSSMLFSQKKCVKIIFIFLKGITLSNVSQKEIGLTLNSRQQDSFAKDRIFRSFLSFHFGLQLSNMLKNLCPLVGHSKIFGRSGRCSQKTGEMSFVLQRWRVS